MSSTMTLTKICKNFRGSITHLSEYLCTILDEHAPYNTSNISVVDRAAWFDQEYRNLRKKYRSAIEYLLYKHLCTQANELAYKKKQECLEKRIHNSAHLFRTLYKIVNKVLDRKQAMVLPAYPEDISILANFNK